MIELHDKDAEVGDGGNEILVADREQVRPAGALKVMDTGPTNPFIELRLMIEVPVEPALTEAGATRLAEIEKSTILIVI